MLHMPDDESLLWSQFKNGDRDAFAALYRQHSLPLIAYGIKLCGDRDLLKDQIQELFVELWNSRENLSSTDSVKFYLFRALRYKLVRSEKNRQSRIHLIRSAADAAGDPLEDSVEKTVVEKEIRESYRALMKKALKELTPRQQEVIQLRFYHGFSNEQIAELMNMNYQSVSNLLYRSLSRLKEKIKFPDFTTLLLFYCFA